MEFILTGRYGIISIIQLIVISIIIFNTFKRKKEARKAKSWITQILLTLLISISVVILISLYNIRLMIYGIESYAYQTSPSTLISGLKLFNSFMLYELIFHVTIIGLIYYGLCKKPKDISN